MTNIKAIANKTSILGKLDMSFLNASCGYNFGLGGCYYNVASSSQYAGIENFGICYYTTNINNKTYIPFSAEQFMKDNSGSDVRLIIATPCVTSGNLSVKARNIQTYPVYYLLEGLNENTTYHIGGYYVLNGDNITMGFSTVTTKSSSGTSLLFNSVTIDSSASSQSNATAMKTLLDSVLPKVSAMFDDATNVSATYSPIVKYESDNYAAKSSMVFNSYRFHYHSSEGYWRSTTIHELQHNHFQPKGLASGEFSTDQNVIKFMEFATNSEDATWGRISLHYYPIISSSRFDYIDDYLVCMATDVDYLFGTNS